MGAAWMCVAIPETHHMDAVHVNSSLPHCHCTARMEGACDEFHGMHYRAVEVNRHGMMKYIRDVLGLDGNASRTVIV
jgi:hypothetical protein